PVSQAAALHVGRGRGEAGAGGGAEPLGERGQVLALGQGVAVLVVDPEGDPQVGGDPVVVPGSGWDHHAGQLPHRGGERVGEGPGVWFDAGQRVGGDLRQWYALAAQRRG